MTLKMLRIEKAGDLENERVVFQAMANVGIGKYIILQARKSPDGKVYSGPIPSAFWFVTMDVKFGDFVVLYTKAGTQSQKQVAADGPTSYFFYWGLHEAIWSTNFKPTAVLASTWDWTP